MSIIWPFTGTCRAGLHAWRGRHPRRIAGLHPAVPRTLRPAGNPYGERDGRDRGDNDIRFGRFASAAAELAAGKLDRIGQPTLSTPTTGRLRWRRPIARAAENPLDPDHPQPAYQGSFRYAPDRRAGNSFHIDGLEFYDKLSFLKGGIVYASHLTTVSAPTRARSRRRSSAAGSKACCGSAPMPIN